MLSQDDIETLQGKAIKYVEDKDNHSYGSSKGNAYCHWFYRNKSPEYFEDIRKSDGTMKAVVKDYTGDPGSPINGAIKGLFFSANVWYKSTSGEPIPSSPFGTKRLSVPALDLLATAPNIYFADFYCMPCSDNHYVTLVMTTPGSETDKFCAKHLVKLDIKNNPFLFKDQSGKLQVVLANKLYVEMFYTEDLDIKPYLDNLTDCKTVCQGHTTPGGVPKNASCRICNI